MNNHGAREVPEATIESIWALHAVELQHQASGLLKSRKRTRQPEAWFDVSKDEGEAGIKIFTKQKYYSNIFCCVQYVGLHYTNW